MKQIIMLILGIFILVSCAENEAVEKEENGVCTKTLSNSAIKKQEAKFEFSAKDDEVFLLNKTMSMHVRPDVLQLYLLQGLKEHLDTKGKCPNNQDEKSECHDYESYRYEIDEEEGIVYEFYTYDLKNQTQKSSKEEDDTYHSFEKTYKQFEKDGYNCKRK